MEGPGWKGLGERTLVEGSGWRGLGMEGPW